MTKEFSVDKEAAKDYHLCSSTEKIQPIKELYQQTMLTEIISSELHQDTIINE